MDPTPHPLPARFVPTDLRLRHPKVVHDVPATRDGRQTCDVRKARQRPDSEYSEPTLSVKKPTDSDEQQGRPEAWMQL